MTHVFPCKFSEISKAANTLCNLLHIYSTFYVSQTNTLMKLNLKRSFKINRTWELDFLISKILFTKPLLYIWPSFSAHFLFIFSGSFDLHLLPYIFFLTQSQNNVLWIVCAEELKTVFFYMITFIFKMVTLIFFVLVE